MLKSKKSRYQLILQRYFLYEYRFCLVGAAFSREYLIRTVLPRFIAAESRSHKGRITKL